MANTGSWLRNDRAHVLILIGAPILLLAVFAVTGFSTIPVFKLDLGRLQYTISAQRYTSTPDGIE